MQGCRLLLKSLGTKSDTVDGRNPAPPGISTSTCAGFLPNSSEVNGCCFLGTDSSWIEVSNFALNKTWDVNLQRQGDRF